MGTAWSWRDLILSLFVDLNKIWDLLYKPLGQVDMNKGIPSLYVTGLFFVSLHPSKSFEQREGEIAWWNIIYCSHLFMFFYFWKWILISEMFLSCTFLLRGAVYTAATREGFDCVALACWSSVEFVGGRSPCLWFSKICAVSCVCLLTSTWRTSLVSYTPSQVHIPRHPARDPPSHLSSTPKPSPLIVSLETPFRQRPIFLPSCCTR